MNISIVILSILSLNILFAHCFVDVNNKGLISRIRVKREWTYPPINIVETSPQAVAYFKQKIIGTVKSSTNPPTYELMPTVAVKDGIFDLVTNPGSASADIWQLKPVDREQTPRFTLTILALDANGNKVEDPVEVTVNVLDVNDNAPVFVQSSLHGNVSEAATIGTILNMKVEATDADLKGENYGVVSFYYVSPTDDKKFNISENGQQILLNGEVDFETTPQLTFVVVAKDGYPGASRSETTATVTITVLDANDHAPVYTNDKFDTSVGELLPVQSTVMKLSASDIDQGINKAVSFKIDSGNTDEQFSVRSNPSADGDSTGEIVLNKPLDFESGLTDFSLRVTAYNKDAKNPDLYSTTKTFEIKVTDENEAPQFTQEAYSGYVRENNPDPVPDIATVQAIDNDFGGNQTVTYTIDNNEGWFIISSDGKITANEPVDREHPSVNPVTNIYELAVRATDNHPVHPRSSVVTVNVEIGDVNDNAPEKGSGWREIVCENVNRKYKNVTIVTVVDKDTPQNGPPFHAKILEYTDIFMAEGYDDDRFGILSDVLQFDAAEQNLYEIPIQLTDSTSIPGESVMTSTQTLTLSICSCNSDYVPDCSFTKPVAGAGFSVAAIVAIIAAILLLLIIVLAVVAYRRRNMVELEKQALFLDEDDVRENLQAYHDEGGGEEDNDAYNISVLQAPPPPHPKRTDEPPQGQSAPFPRSKIPPDTDIGDYINGAKDIADNDPTAPPFDSLLVFDYEGQGSDAGSLSSLNSGTTDGSQDYDYLNNWGPRFKKLADMYGGGESD
ncbi:cadherin-2-like isoform X2 [Clavelina lepadiformis]|uniref:Cadherin domain-containing protein n=1 Tax=Clavelina lepadiformis TaxID=159417 RepID=A0ABP0F7C4_CLALP